MAYEDINLLPAKQAKHSVNNMTSLLALLVLSAALLHAVWNTLVKSGGTPEFTIAGFQLVGALVCLEKLGTFVFSGKY